MSFIKKILIIPAVLSFTITACSPSVEEVRKVEVLYTSNTAGFLAPCDCPDDYLHGSLAEIRELVNKNRQKNTLVLGAGNFLAPFPDRLRNEYVFKFLKETNFDGLIPGENEFRMGMGFFTDRSEKFNIPVVSGNLELYKNEDRISNKYLIKEMGDLKIALIGIFDSTIYNNFNESSPGSSKMTGTGKEYLEKILPLLKEKSDLVFILSSGNLKNDRGLAASTGGIDLIINGYSKEKIEEKVNDTLIFSPGYKGKFLGKLKLVLGEDKKVETYENKFLSLEMLTPDLDGPGEELLEEYTRRRREQMEKMRQQ